jgi:hypothetical protein
MIDINSGEKMIPEMISDDALRALCLQYREEIGAGFNHLVPKVYVRYVCDNNSFGYTTLSNCFFFFDYEMYVWESDKKWKADHNQDVVEGVFGEECKGRGYAHRVIYAGVSTDIKDSNGEYMYTGDVIELSNGDQTAQLALCALPDGYGFRFGNNELLLSKCKNVRLTRVGTVFFQLDWNEYSMPVIDRAIRFNNVKDSNERHEEKVFMSKFTPNFDQEVWKYYGLDVMGVEYHWKK